MRKSVDALNELDASLLAQIMKVGAQVKTRWGAFGALLTEIGPINVEQAELNAECANKMLEVMKKTLQDNAQALRSFDGTNSSIERSLNRVIEEVIARELKIEVAMKEIHSALEAVPLETVQNAMKRFYGGV